MKQLIYIFAFIIVSINASAQCVLTITATVTPTTSCTANDGMISYSITGGTGPYSVTYTVNGSQNYSLSSPITNLPAGSYLLWFMDSVWCYDTLTVFVPNPNQIYLNPVVTDVTGSCTNCNGAINLNASGGFGSLTYNWSNGATTSSISNLCKGTYWGNVHDTAGCSENLTFTVIDQYTAGINLNTTTQSPACQLCDGWIDMSPSGGTAPYSYQWSNGASTNVIANLCSGTYAVTVTDGLGCTKNNYIVLHDSVISLYQYQFNDSITHESCIGANDGSIQITYNIPSANFIYSWSNGSTTADINNLAAGLYELYVMDTVTHQCFIVGDSMWGGFGVGVNGSGPNCGNISGRIYFDNDTNCIFSGTDYGFSSSFAHAIINPGSHNVYPDNQGYYSASVAYGVYNVSHDVNSSLVGASCNPVQNVILNAASPTAVNIDFADSSTVMADLAIFANCSTGVLAGFNAVFDVWLSNFSFNPASGTVYFVLDSVLSFDSASVTPSYINGDTLFWTNQFAALAFPSDYIKVYCYCDPSTPITYVLNLCAGVIPNGLDLLIPNNTYCFQALANGSFDPNVKSVSPVGTGPDGNVSLNEYEFTYMIQFQNTGTAPAQNVIIVDTLSPLLDWNTLHILHSSHNYVAQLDAGGIARFRFPNINLPDSGSNEPLSHGYIQYAVNRVANVQSGNQIKNAAGIYFDFNAPVITNTVTNTFAAPSAIEAYTADNGITVFPNPARDEISITFTVVGGDANTGEKTITLCDVTGRIQKTISINNTSSNGVSKLSLKNISEGIYFVNITDANGLKIASAKVILN